MRRGRKGGAASPYKRRCAPHNNADTGVRGRAAHNSAGRKQESRREGEKHDSTAGHRWRREQRLEGRGRGRGGRTHARSKGLVRIIPASVYRSEARANQTDIIDLTCDLEIRKITDGERLEPIIIVNIDRPSSHSSAALVQAFSLVLASNISLAGDRTASNYSLLSIVWPLSLGPPSPRVPFFLYVSSFSPSTPCHLFPNSSLLVLSFHLRVSLAPVRRPFSVQSFYLY